MACCVCCRLDCKSNHHCPHSTTNGIFSRRNTHITHLPNDPPIVCGQFSGRTFTGYDRACIEHCYKRAYRGSSCNDRCAAVRQSVRQSIASDRPRASVAPTGNPAYHRHGTSRRKNGWYGWSFLDSTISGYFLASFFPSKVSLDKIRIHNLRYCVTEALVVWENPRKKVSLDGSNIAGFIKVGDAMLAQGM